MLKVAGRMGIKPIPCLRAVVTASNIGIADHRQPVKYSDWIFSGIGYRDFLLHLSPVARVYRVLTTVFSD